MAYKPKHTLAGYKRRGDFIGAAMHEYKHGSLHHGGTGQLVKDRSMAIAIGLSMQRQHEAKRRNKSGQDFNILGHAALAGGHAGHGRSI